MIAVCNAEVTTKWFLYDHIACDNNFKKKSSFHLILFFGHVIKIYLSGWQAQFRLWWECYDIWEGLVIPPI